MAHLGPWCAPEAAGFMVVAAAKKVYVCFYVYLCLIIKLYNLRKLELFNCETCEIYHLE
jgi:hypothetical protein